MTYIYIAPAILAASMRLCLERVGCRQKVASQHRPVPSSAVRHRCPHLRSIGTHICATLLSTSAQHHCPHLRNIAVHICAASLSTSAQHRCPHLHGITVHICATSLSTSAPHRCLHLHVACEGLGVPACLDACACACVRVQAPTARERFGVGWLAAKAKVQRHVLCMYTKPKQIAKTGRVQPHATSRNLARQVPTF